MKNIRINFHSAMSKGNIDYWLDLLSVKFNPIISENYDYYFVNEALYWKREYMDELLESRSDAIRIFGCGEAVFPDLNIFDYAIWHCNHYSVDDRVVYDPLLRTDIGYIFDDFVELDVIKNEKDIAAEVSKKERFCNFIYANPNSHSMRDSLFYEISKYKQVESLGRHLKNVDIEDTRDAENWAKLSIELKSRYKFSIAAENAVFPGYTSEKIVTSFMANTIPIYWGNPYVEEEFNADAFINANKYRNVDDLIGRIKEIDESDDLYMKMLLQPCRTKSQIENCNESIRLFYINLYHIFEQDKNVAFRRPMGCWPDFIYSKFMKRYR